MSTGRMALVTGLAAVVLMTGCGYLQHRVEDAGDMMDLGLTFSRRPGFALYYDFVPVVPIGCGRVEGAFVGLGAGRVGTMPHLQRSTGLILWGEEELAYGQYDPADPESMRFQRSGLIGLPQGPIPGPDYMLSCPHYVHLGWFGVVATPRYLQMLDFLLGWTTLDIGLDDGSERGQWP